MTCVSARCSPSPVPTLRAPPRHTRPDMRTIFAAAGLLAAIGHLAGAQNAPAVRIDLPVVDAPYNVKHGLRAPSMAQSLAVTEGFYELAHTAIQRAWGTHGKLAAVSLILFDTFGGLLPGG